MSQIETEYRKRIAAMDAVERVRRADALFRWSRDYLIRAIVKRSPGISDTTLRWELAVKQYDADPEFRKLASELRTRAAR